MKSRQQKFAEGEAVHLSSARHSDSLRGVWMYADPAGLVVCCERVDGAIHYYVSSIPWPIIEAALASRPKRKKRKRKGAK
jgi:hypothetical protein